MVANSGWIGPALRSLLSGRATRGKKRRYSQKSGKELPHRPGNWVGKCVRRTASRNPGAGCRPRKSIGRGNGSEKRGKRRAIGEGEEHDLPGPEGNCGWWQASSIAFTKLVVQGKKTRKV